MVLHDKLRDVKPPELLLEPTAPVNLLLEPIAPIKDKLLQVRKQHVAVLGMLNHQDPLMRVHFPEQHLLQLRRRLRPVEMRTIVWRHLP